MSRPHHTIMTLRAAVEDLEHTPDAGTPAMDLGELYELGNLLTQATQVLREVADRADEDVRGHLGANLRDDAGLDPNLRLGAAIGELEHITARLAHAHTATRAYHSEIGHLAYREDP